MSEQGVAVVATDVVYTQGDLATIVLPSNRYPCLVVERTADTLTLARIEPDPLPEGADVWPVASWRFSVDEAIARKTAVGSKHIQVEFAGDIYL